MRVDRKSSGPLAPIPPPSPRPRPPFDDDHEGDDESTRSLNTVDWDAIGDKVKSTSTRGASSVVVVSSGSAGQKKVADDPVHLPAPAQLLSVSLPLVDVPRILHREAIPALLEVDEYGSNLPQPVPGRSSSSSPATRKPREGPLLVDSVEFGGRPVGSSITAADSPSWAHPLLQVAPLPAPLLRSARRHPLPLVGVVLAARARSVSPRQLGTALGESPS
ncbi:hypothetical protein ZWY2020_003631 [Hordeum vulgare]|nr:hypothetical protein ZWY2020_003631 [Hordeum vulgare]